MEITTLRLQWWSITLRRSLRLTWRPPMHDGGAPVQMHELQMRPSGTAALATGMPDEWLLMYQVMQNIQRLILK